jgi:hypothetical protein
MENLRRSTRPGDTIPAYRPAPRKLKRLAHQQILDNSLDHADALLRLAARQRRDAAFMMRDLDGRRW